MQYRLQSNTYRDFETQEQNKCAARAYAIPYPDQESFRTIPLGEQRYRSPYVTVLSGAWDFHYYSDVSLLPHEIETDSIKFEEIQVPSTWQRTGYEPPVYVNSRYEFDGVPLEIPEQLSVGLYRKKFLIEKTEGTHLLNFLGVASSLDLYCNGYHVGYSEGAHNTAEFDLAKVIQQGENELIAVVHKWSTGTFLECQDMFREQGIFRDVLLYTLPSTFVYDFWLRPTKTGDGEYKVETTLEIHGDMTGYSVDLQIEGLNANYHNAAKERMKITFEKLQPTEWNAELPTIYEAFLTLKNGAEVQVIHIPVGFRSIELKNEVLLFNGQKIKLKGVNHHDTHHTKGYCMSYEDYERDLMLMKEYHVNAIRTSHYPPDAHLLQLADRLGFYVIDEADIETHGCIPNYKNTNLIANDKKWLNRFLDRVKRMFFRDRSHACVLMWSLGNESGGKHCHDACNAYLQAIQPEVPVHYSFVQSYVEDGYSVYSQMYTGIETLRQIAENQKEDGSPLEKYRGKPFLLCEYAHAMGVGPGGVEQYWEEIFYKYDQMMGGCVWEWADHAVYHPEELALYRWTYGGDHGERVHDRNFCCDGLFYPDRRPHSGALCLRNVYRPVRARWLEGKIEFRNTNRFANAKYTVAWELLRNGMPVNHGEIAIDVPPLKTSTSAMKQQLKLSDGEYFLTLRYLDSDGKEQAFEQFCVQEAALPEEKSSSKGDLSRILRTMRVNVTRAWHDNELAVKKNYLSLSDLGPAFSVDTRTEKISSGGVRITVRLRTYPNQLPEGAELPRFGITLELPKTFENVTYYGLGNQENLPDMKAHALMGIHETTVDEMHEPYLRPQENGTRSEVRWLKLTDAKGKGVKVTNVSKPLFFTAHHYSQATLEAANHEEDLRHEGVVFLSLDGFFRGTGTAACGPDVLKEYRVLLSEAGLEFSFTLMPINP